MTSSNSLAHRADLLAELIEKRLGVRGHGLEAKLRRAGRLLPRKVRRDAGLLVEARRLMAHPKLHKHTDPAALDIAFQHCEAWLKSVDPAERRKDHILRLLAVNALNLLLVSAAFVAYLVWSGHL